MCWASTAAERELTLQALSRLPNSSLQEAHYSTSHGRLDPALVAQHVHRRDAVAGDSSKARWVSPTMGVQGPDTDTTQLALDKTS